MRRKLQIIVKQTGKKIGGWFASINARLNKSELFNHRYANLISTQFSTKHLQRNLMLSATILALASLVPYLAPASYNLDRANVLLDSSKNIHANKLIFNKKENVYDFNKGYIPSPKEIIHTPGPQITAKLHKDGSKGISVTDPINKLDFSVKPVFSLHEGKKDANRVVFPLRAGGGWLVYSMQSTGVKEDIVLTSSPGNSAVWDYEIKLEEGFESRLEQNGSIGIYGNPLMLGDVTTASKSDEALLKAAIKNGSKDTLLFSIPAPIVIENGEQQSKVDVKFELDGNQLSVIAEGLNEASYPLSIDPSIYVETAEKFMRGNNESNVDFDVSNTLIQKGKTTGARFDQLTSTTSLPAARWNHATAAAGGYIYTVGGSNGTANQSSIYWAKLNTSNNSISSPNPGNGACASWCTNTAYNLPSPRVAHTAVTYNGYLYVLGGEDASCTTANGTGTNGKCKTVYVSKLGANGEPQLWHPTDTNKTNWVYWYRANDLSTPRSYTSAAAYNNYLYLAGGKTDSSNGVTTMEYVDLKPNGTLTSWSSTNMTALPSARFGHNLLAYNDKLYLVGGTSGGVLQNTVDYISLNSDGTMVSSWTSTKPFKIARTSWGGRFSTILGGYLYISGGCSAVDAEGECTSTGITNGGTYQSNGTGTAAELVSINGDGSLGFWGIINNIANARIGYSLVGWRNTIYTIGGCTAQNTATGACTTTSAASYYGVINTDGDGSTVATSVASGTSPCSGTDPYQCNLPGISNVGNMLTSTTIMNGYLYIIGGCMNTGCTSTSGNTAYAAISADGQLRRPASCAGGTIIDSFCVDSTDPVSGGIAAAGVTIFGGNIYLIGGISGAGLKNNIFHVSVNNDGSLAGTWQAQTFTNVGATSVAYTFAHARANPSSAGTYPGNLYIFGGCTGAGSGVGCNSGSNTGAVYKCNIKADGSLEENLASRCSTTNQLQIGTVPGASAPGLALHSGAVYAGYVYLVGGTSPGKSGIKTIRYAKIDNNNNIVAVSGSTWQEAKDSSNNPIQMSTGRERSSAFGYNGYLYTVGGYDASGSGTLSDIQFAKINTSTGNLESFKTSTITINQRWGLSVPVSNSYAYVIGGCTAGNSPSCTTATNTMQTFQIYNNDSGSPAKYTSASNLFPTDRFGASATILNGYVYLAGGCIGTFNCDNATDVVEYAPLNNDGSFGTWSTTTSLPQDRVYGQLEAVGGTLYFLGGQNDSRAAQSTVYYATPAGNGTIGSWSTASGALGDTAAGSPSPLTNLSAAVWNNRIYVTGGYNASKTPTTSVYISPQLANGGNISADSWSTGTSFNTARDGTTAITYANNLYILGGHDGLNYLSDVQYAKINSDGSIGSWNYTASLPRKVSDADGFAANGYMYIFGGKESDINCTSNTYVAPISGNTTIASGNNPTGLGTWFLTNERFSAERSNAAAIYSGGKAYLLGGSCGTLAAVPGDDVIDDDFDPNIDNSMWSSTTDMAIGTSCGTVHTGNSLYSLGDNSAQAITKDVDVSYGGTISFYLKIPTSNIGSCRAPNSSDEDVELQYSSNGGSGWTTMATYENTNFNTPIKVTETIPSVARTPNTRFRWYIPNADNNRDMWAIDTVIINANQTPPQEELMEDDFDPSLDVGDWSSTTDMTEGTVCGTLGSGNALYSTGGNTAQAITNDFNLQYGGLVKFNLRIPTSSGGGCDQPQNNEDVELQYSTNSGSSWTTFATYNESLYDTPTEITTGIPAGAFSSNTRFRWYIPEADAGSDQWAIDDVFIYALQPVLTYTGIHRGVYSSLLSQAQKAKYSIMFDTDNDVFPTTWLLNGVDNSIGAKWRLQYRSMADPAGTCTSPAMSSWGQSTNFGDVTLGVPGIYTPKNAAGTNTNCARYYSFTVDVDSSKAFGYPEDVSRGPTITDLSLQFTANPSKRLMHGRTFLGGLQQPDDTPTYQF